MISRVVLALALTAPPAMNPAMNPAMTSAMTPAVNSGATPGTAARHPCPVAMPPRTTCGFLEVPERRDAPGRTVKVGYAVRVAGAGEADPLVFMGGGPGSASMDAMSVLSAMFPDRDVVTVEPRGGRHSQPSLACPETAQALLGQLRRPAAVMAADGTADGTADGAIDRAADVAAAALRCRDRLREEGVDLRGYRTQEIAADVVALREELGYDAWHLFGVGYSTRVMLGVAAADPGGVRSAVLDSFLPMGAGRYDGAERDLGGTLARLGVGERFASVRARLNASPARVPMTDTVLGRAFTARVTGDDLAAIMAGALRGADVAAVAPALVGGLAEGRDELLRPLVDAAGERLAARVWGLYHAVQCQDEVPFNTFTPKSRLFTINADKAVCDAWQVSRSEPANATPSAPVYVLAGRYDPAAPAATARSAARALPDARFEEFAGASHAVFLTSGCARAKITAFVADPATTPAAPCAAPTGPGDLHVTGAPYLISRSPWLAAPFAAFALASLVQLVSGALRGRAPAAFGGLAGVAFTGLMAQSAHALAGANGSALAVGVPGTTGPYTWIAVASAVLTAAALLRDRGWPQIAATVIGAGFLIWWFTWFL
ncbi:alpha/beta hydrolase [Nonomuraea deserti]|uniref:Alpha/beta hydrolase n=1 Tax=Nonomuraea deserti TaxID=1848322 RepID=A0A4R4VG88_9ACTN|nr:alpha/beta hydrolase [Nonomuraea deserti]TDD04402.1 alpha/beta hydrolase [Nonomuraea deserti]